MNKLTTILVSLTALALATLALATLACGDGTETAAVSDVGNADVSADSWADGDTDSTTDAEEETEEAETEANVEPECHEVAECDDGVECTDDTCLKGRCFHIPNPVKWCEDSDACTISVCNQKGNFQGGCEFKPAPCDDDDACTKDSCDKFAGCIHTPDGTVMCNDGNACTNDLCEANACQHTPVACDDGDLHTVDGCTPSVGCYHDIIECDESWSPCPEPNPCVAVTCQFEKCLEVPLVCDDGIACTNDNCLGGDCVFNAIPGWCLDDGSVCTDMYCDGSTSGDCWSLIAMTCDDGNPCTQDSCDPTHGCQSEVIPGCCLTDSQCETGDACQIPVCGVDHFCTQIKKDCDDGVDCTLNECDTNGNCVNAPHDTFCQGGMVCNPTAGGCAECADWTYCGGKNPCNPGVCQFGVCVYSPIQCPAPQVCDDQYGNCIYPPGTCSEAWQCQDKEKPCTTWECVDHICLGTPVVCDDGNKCTNDSCNKFTGWCNYEWQKCDDGNACTQDSCDEALGCQHQAIDCEDGNACTTDQCHAKFGCKNSWVDCDDGDKCTNDGCSEPDGCYHKLIDTNCRDCDVDADCPVEIVCKGAKVVKYSGACNVNGCDYATGGCYAESECAVSECVTGIGCQYKNKCDDGDPCTFDNCGPGGSCNYSKVPNCVP